MLATLLNVFVVRKTTKTLLLVIEMRRKLKLASLQIRTTKLLRRKLYQLTFYICNPI